MRLLEHILMVSLSNHESLILQQTRMRLLDKFAAILISATTLILSLSKDGRAFRNTRS